MKKVIGAVVIVAIGIGGYLYRRKAAAPASPTPAPPWVAPAINDKSDDIDRVFAACGPPKIDRSTPDTTKIFAGGSLRTVDYGHDDPKLGHVSVYLNFDNPRTGWRFRGASPSLAATDRDLTIDELRIFLPCAAAALDNEASSDGSEPGDGDSSSGGKASSDGKAAKDTKTPTQDKAP